MPGSGFDPALALAALAGALVVAAYGLASVPPPRRFAYVPASGLVGSIGDQLVGTRLSPIDPALGGLHAPEALADAWLLVLLSRRLGV